MFAFRGCPVENTTVFVQVMTVFQQTTSHHLNEMTKVTDTYMYMYILNMLNVGVPVRTDLVKYAMG